MPDESHKLGRRSFLRLGLLAGLSKSGALAAPPAGAGSQPPSAEPGAAPGTPLPPAVYLSFSPDEATFTEALVNILCPADELTPNGVDCGLAQFIDRQLAGSFGRGERLYRRGPFRPARPELGYQLPLTPEEYYKAGVAAADAASRRVHGGLFSTLSPADGDHFLNELTAGTITDEHVSLAHWFDDLVYPLFTQACFADPAYGGNRNKVFWKMLGYPGLPAVNAENITRYRGVPFPGAHEPKSMEDFS